jgi:hypothetical protein
MAKKITAIRRYKPEIERESTLQMAEIIPDMTRSTGLSHGEVLHVVYQLQELILEAHRQSGQSKLKVLVPSPRSYVWMATWIFSFVPM